MIAVRVGGHDQRDGLVLVLLHEAGQVGLECPHPGLVPAVGGVDNHADLAIGALHHDAVSLADVDHVVRAALPEGCVACGRG